MGADRKRIRRTTIGGAFAPRLIEMLESPAFRALSLSAHRVLARIEVEMGHHAGTDNGRLPVTFVDFERYGLHRHAIAPAIRECVALGFLEYIPGAAGNAEFRRPSLFRLTYRHTDRNEPIETWRNIKTVAEAARLADDARKAESLRRPKKQNPGAGKRQLSVPVSTTEKTAAPVPVSTTTMPVPVSVTTSISRGGGPVEHPEESATPDAAQTSGRAARGQLAETPLVDGRAADSIGHYAAIIANQCRAKTVP